MPYANDWAQPAKLGKSLGKPFWGNLKPVIGEKGGDFTCLLSLFFDNLSTMVGVTSLFILLAPADESTKAKELMYERAIPACGLVLFIGNFYMSWLATRMKTQYGRDFTAQPYGINTVGAYPFVGAIMLPIAAVKGVETAWKAGVAGNFVVGLINVALGIAFSIPPVLNFMLKNVPIAAFVIPCAGVGLTWLCLNQLAPNFGTPMAGFIPMLGMMLAYYGQSTGSPFKIGKFTVPGVLMWIMPGYVLGWIYGLPLAADPNYEFKWPGGGLWIGGALGEGMSEIGPYIGTVLPIAIVATMSGYMCLVSAQNNGDPYPIGETLIVDGIMTCIAALFGSPFGTVVYFGQPVHKNIGGKYAYSVMNGFIYLILTLSGVFGFIAEISPAVAIGPTIAIFGFMLAEECTKVMPQRHHWIIFFTLFFGFCDYFAPANGAGRPPEIGAGLHIMKQGSLLNCMLWSAMLVYAVDAKWLAASAVAGIATFCALFGLTHQDMMFEGEEGEADMTRFTKGSAGFTGGNTGKGWNHDGVWLGEGDRYSTSALQVALAYLSLIIFWFLPFKFLQKYEPITTAKDAKDDLAMNVKKVVIGGTEAWWAPAEGGGATRTSSEVTKAEA